MTFQHKHLYIKDLLNKHLKSAYFLHTKKVKKNVSKKDTLPLPYIIVETRCLMFSKNNKKTFLLE